MKTKTIMLAVITGMTGFILTSCQSKEQKLENAQENVVDANEDLAKAQREFREEQENRIRENDMSIETYRAGIKDQKEDMRVEYENKVDSLERRNRELKVKLDSYDEKNSTNEKWESFKREFNHDAEELKRSLNDMSKNNVK